MLNRVFKVIFNYRIGQFVVTSELAKSHSKYSTTDKRQATSNNKFSLNRFTTAIAIAILGGSAAIGSMNVWAATTPTGGLKVNSTADTKNPSVIYCDTNHDGSTALTSTCNTNTASSVVFKGSNSNINITGANNTVTVALADKLTNISSITYTKGALTGSGGGGEIRNTPLSA